MAATIEHPGAFEARIESMRARLLPLLELTGSGTEIVFSPSGTDAQLQALVLVRALLGGPIASIAVAADETGSGTSFAIAGRHFNTSTALGHAVTKGEMLPGLDDAVARFDVFTRDENGHLRTGEAMDRAVIAAVAQAIGAGRKVLLQTMDRSKLWRRAPSQQCLSEIKARWPSDVQVVVDACQVRLSPERIRTYLSRGEMVLITGSKFFTGPPFSGALLVPAALSARLCGNVAIPRGLEDYSNASDWPVCWQAIRTQLPDGYNVGQWLRWEAGLAEMDAYFAVPQNFRSNALAQFAATASRLIGDGDLELLDEGPRDTSDAIDDLEFSTRTILPFTIRRNGAGLPREAVAGIYRALNCDISDHLPPGASAQDRQMAAQLCHIGQPVAVRTADGTETAALRISAGARILSESWCADAETAERNLQGECAQVGLIVEKIGLLVRHQISV